MNTQLMQQLLMAMVLNSVGVGVAFTLDRPGLDRQTRGKKIDIQDDGNSVVLTVVDDPDFVEEVVASAPPPPSHMARRR